MMGLTGNSVRVGILDSGVDDDHLDFKTLDDSEAIFKTIQ